MNGFRNYHHASLDIPSQHNLRGCLPVLCSRLHQHRILKQAASSFAERRPCLYLYAVLIHILFGENLLVIRMCFHLIDHRADAGKGGQIHHPVRIEIGNPDRTQLSLLIQFLQSPPCPVIIGKRLMQQHQIKVISLQLPQ